ncbi:uncharacterized protein C8Q71DRAFT_863338 [Rhodofomes roseus]|uniref:BTB domain-containing protein n=1 Tax=Rhodofomes roseus TaxID=34475 RepID=A0ABQ8JZA1_9APHY|nr:uncharacterized protein C8Q71DRAFT_863338 [Rhodofomes roseus]KAH9829411.1 hypothetical protein C8Q71DRAFT_863338 [Rhodofomes roseus]
MSSPALSAGTLVHMTQVQGSNSRSTSSDLAMIATVGEGNTEAVTIKLRTEMTMTMTRSSRFWVPDGNLFIGVGKTLYRLYTGTFANHSTVFSGMFELPAGVSHRTEGTSEASPLYLWGIDVIAFEALIDYLGGAVLPDGESQQPFSPSTRQLVGILQLATMWDMTRARFFAIEKLEAVPLSGDPEWGPIAKIACCLAYGVEPWLVPALKLVLGLGPREWDSEHFAYFKAPTDAMRIFVLWLRIDRHRKALAWSPPRHIQGASCNSPTQCGSRWTATWYQALASKLLHPDAAMSDHELLSFICDDMGRRSGLCYSCHFQVTFAMKHDSTDWSKEDVIIQSVADQFRRDYAFYA